jgi:hypothetical protein
VSPLKLRLRPTELKRVRYLLGIEDAESDQAGEHLELDATPRSALGSASYPASASSCHRSTSRADLATASPAVCVGFAIPLRLN